MNKLNVLHLVQGLEIGGLELMVITLLEGLDVSRFKPAVCCFDVIGSLADRLTAKGIPIYFLCRKPGIDSIYPFRLARLLKEKQINILHLHNPTALFYGTLAGKIARTSNIIYTEHGRDFSSSKKVRFANKLMSYMVDEIVVVAEHGKNYLILEEKFNGAKIRKVYNGIDSRQFDSTYYKEKKAEILAKIGLKAEIPIIGVVARLDPIKNHTNLLKAMVIVNSALPDSALLVIGDGPLRSELEHQVETLGLQKDVKFLGARSDVPELLSVLDVFVLPSYSEGLSLTLIEACAAGRPIVATEVGGNSEVVDHGKNGLLVPSNDPTALAVAIIKILLNKDLARQMSQKALEKFNENFTAEIMVGKYEKLYKNAL